MKRRNAETGKLRRPLKRTKIVEGMYGNSMLYLKFVMVWASVVLADYMLEFRFEFLWPFWMMLRSVYDSYKYQGLAFSVFFICIALTSDMICYFFIPVQYIFFAASTYVWVQYVWYSFAEKGICVPTVAICCFIVYMEGVRGVGVGSGPWSGAGGSARVLAAHAVGFPAVTLGVGVKAVVAARLRAHTQRAVHAHNAFYFRLMRDALPESVVSICAECGAEAPCECSAGAPPPRANGAPANLAGGGGVRPAGAPPPRRRSKQENGHCTRDIATLQFKLDQIEQHIERKNPKEKSDKSHNHVTSNVSNSLASSHSNGVAHGPGCHEDDDKHVHSKGSAKSSKYDKKESTTSREERRKHKNRDKDKEISDSHKSTEQTKEQIVKDKEVENSHTTDTVKIKEMNGITRDRDRERDGDREAKEREKEAKEREREQREKEKENREKEKEAKEREKEREKEKEKEARSNREAAEELKRVRSELSAARSALTSARSELSSLRTELASVRTELNLAKQNEAEVKKQLVVEKQRKQERHTHNKSCAWGRERAVLERRLADERRARHAAELQLQHSQDTSGSTSTSTSTSTSGSVNGEGCTSLLRRELARARSAQLQLQRDLHAAHEQLRTAEVAATAADTNANGVALGWAARAAQLERALSAETRVKLDLLAALGDANRRMHIQDSIINRQEKELEELKAQMLAVMPTELVGPAGGAVSKLRLADRSPLDPNATVYTPKQLCSDA